MVDIKIHISDDLNKKFREVAMRKYGYTKGALSIAAQRALSDWAVRNEGMEKAKFVIKKYAKDPIEELEGMLSHVKSKTSVQLKRESLDAWAEMAGHYKRNKR